MKYFCLYAFILLTFIILMSYYNSTLFEAFSQKSDNKTIILLGDSILKNDAYVSDGKSVEDIITERNKQTYCFAEDHSKIVDIYNQVHSIPYKLDLPNTYIFLSAGGNDILSHYVDQNQDITNTSILKTMFSAYKKLIKSIQTRLPKTNIILLDIYYPDNLQYKQFRSIIEEWNNMVYSFSKTQSNNIYSIIQISNHLTSPDDFSFGIEPSSLGGKKIADLILQNKIF